MKKLIFILSCIFLYSTVIASEEYYVKNGGNDSADGLSDENAWETIAKVEATVISGDTVYFRSQDSWTNTTALPTFQATAGVVYDGATYGTGIRATFVTGAVGTSTNSASIQLSASNVTFKGFEIDGNSTKATGVFVGEGATTNISNIIIDNVEVHNVGDPGDEGWLYGILVTGYKDDPGIIVSNVTIKNSTVRDCDHEGIALYDTWGTSRQTNRTDGVLVDNCNLYNNLQGITVVNDTDNVVIQNCDIYGNPVGIWGRISGCATDACGSGDWQNLVIRKNKIHDNDSGISLQPGTTDTSLNQADNAIDAKIYSNLIYNNTSFDIVFSAPTSPPELTYYDGEPFEIYNNTIYNTGGSAFGIVSFLPYSNAVAAGHYPEFIFKNNIVYSTDQRAVYNHWAGTTFTFDNNLIFRSDSAANTHVTDVIGVDYTRAEVVSIWDADAQNTDPLFTNISNADFSLTDSSDAIDTGATLGSPYNSSIDGTSRPQGAAYDIGAYEWRGHINGAQPLFN